MNKIIGISLLTVFAITFMAEMASINGLTESQYALVGLLSLGLGIWSAVLNIRAK